MIIFDIGCENGHRFEGWFSAPGDYDSQLAAGHLDCPVCGSSDVRRVPTASRINTRSSNPVETPSDVSSDLAGSVPGEGVAETMAKLRAYIEQHYVDVGEQFPEEARKIHYGEAEARNLRGVAGAQQIGELLEEGIAIVPLPGMIGNTKKLN